MPVITVFGAGPGLGRAVAHRYAREGYDVVLVGRRPQPLQDLASELDALGATVHAVTGDLSDLAGIGDLASRIRAAAGDPDVIYYAPVSSEVSFVPAAEQTAGTAEQITTLLYLSLVAIVQEFLPHLLATGSGAILTAQGASALAGLPGMSGPGPAAAAQRSYLQSLAAEVGAKGVFVGRLYIASIIGGSAVDTQMQTAQEAGAEVLPMAITPAAELADRLWTMHADAGPNEAVIPESNPFTS